MPTAAGYLHLHSPRHSPWVVPFGSRRMPGRRTCVICIFIRLPLAGKHSLAHPAGEGAQAAQIVASRPLCIFALTAFVGFKRSEHTCSTFFLPFTLYR